MKTTLMLLASILTSCSAMAATLTCGYNETHLQIVIKDSNGMNGLPVQILEYGKEKYAGYGIRKNPAAEDLTVSYESTKKIPDLSGSSDLTSFRLSSAIPDREGRDFS